MTRLHGHFCNGPGAKRPSRPPNLESWLGPAAAFYGGPPVANGRLQLEKSHWPAKPFDSCSNAYDIAPVLLHDAAHALVRVFKSFQRSIVVRGISLGIMEFAARHSRTTTFPAFLRRVDHFCRLRNSLRRG